MKIFELNCVYFSNHAFIIYLGAAILNLLDSFIHIPNGIIF